LDGDLPVLPGIPAPPGAWSSSPVFNIPRDADVSTRLSALREDETNWLQAEAHLLQRIIRMVCAAKQVDEPQEILEQLTPMETTRLGQQVEQLRRYSSTLLGSPHLLGTLMAVMKGELDQVAELSPAIRTLVQKGLLQVQSVPAYKLTPVDVE